jgi:tetratricopeptide (TPR) repeat protein
LSVAVLYELIEDYEARGELEVADEIRNRILRDFTNRGGSVLRYYRNRAMSEGDWRRATQLQEELDVLLGSEGQPGRNLDLRRGLTYQRGVQLLEEDRPLDAGEVFERLLQEQPSFIPAIIMLGEARLLEERWEEAVEVWRQGYEATRNPVLLQRIEDHFIEREQPEQAIHTLRKLIARSPDDLFPRFFLGRLYYRLEMLPEAQKVLLEIGDRILASPTYHFLLGRIHERRGEIRLAAEEYLACARQLGVHNAEYLCQRCQARFREWQDRCDSCGSWNSVELAIEEEQLNLEDVSIVRGPIWTPADFEAR